jgi:hypothetical protein
MPEMPRSVGHLYEALRRHVEEQRGKILVLPPTPERLAQLAERSGEFVELSAETERDFRLSRTATLSLLKRCGFFNAVLAAAGGEQAWERFTEHASPRRVELTTLLFLDGCAFARNEFPLHDCEVRQFDQAGLDRLGPGREIADAFFPQEKLDPLLSTGWFLGRGEARDVRPRGFTIQVGDPVMEKFWAPLLSLALYDATCFYVPIMIRSEANWRVERIRFGSPATEFIGPEGEEVLRNDYEVAADEWPAFEAFLGIARDSLSANSEWPAMHIAARRYLRATFSSAPEGDPLDEGQDGYGDVLLHYVYALEALLLAGDHEAISDKIAVRAAWLASTDDAERILWRDFAKSAYNARSKIVHRGRVKKDVDIPRLRNLCRRVICTTLALSREANSADNFDGLLRDLLVSRAVQQRVAESATEVAALIKSTD